MEATLEATQTILEDIKDIQGEIIRVTGDPLRANFISLMGNSNLTNLEEANGGVSSKVMEEVVVLA